MCAKPHLLVVSFAYPPQAFPRAIQVSRLLAQISFDVSLISADYQSSRIDDSIQGRLGGAVLKNHLSIPFKMPQWIVLVSRLFPLWNKCPDPYRAWIGPATQAGKKLLVGGGIPIHGVVTFAQPMSDHLVGGKLKKRFQLPWIAHFSDPWVDNPYNRVDPLAKALNRRLEQQVIAGADGLIFTCEETVALVMGKYPQHWRNKCFVLPHCYDPNDYIHETGNSGPKITIRCIGNFYGPRSPQPLIKALDRIFARDPNMLQNVCFEFVGAIPRTIFSPHVTRNLPEGLINFKGSIPYQESLSLMCSADGLLLIDAPALISVFLPSKLIDYIGAGRPIMAITPPGASHQLVTELGGWIANPHDEEEVGNTLLSFIAFLKSRESSTITPWGKDLVRKKYCVCAVAQQFEVIISAILGEKQNLKHSQN
jgi:glycosyltransferase involved in cell wall biosynthesis